MKGIAYKDRAGGRWMEYKDKSVRRLGQNGELFPSQKRVSRIQEALQELRGMGNILVALIDGNKTRVIFKRDF